MPDVVINLNFGPRMVSVPVETRQRALEIESQSYQLEPEAIRYLIYEGLTPLDIFQYRAAAKGKGKAGKQCKTGQACGNTCISKTKTCKNGLSGATKEKAKNAKSKTTAKGKGGALATGQEQAQPAGNTGQQDGGGLTPWQQERLERLEADRKKYFEENSTENITKRANDIASAMPAGGVGKIKSTSDKLYKSIESSNLKQLAIKEQLDKIENSTTPASIKKRMELQDKLSQEKAKEIELKDERKKLLELNEKIIAVQSSNPGVDLKKLSNDKIVDLIVDYDKNNLESVDSINQKFDISADMIRGIPPLNRSRIKQVEEQIEPSEIAAIKSTTKSMLADEDTGLFIAIKPEFIDSVLTEGVKNAIELGKKSTNYLDERYVGEREAMGIPYGDPPPGYARPVYGYIESKKAIRGNSIVDGGGGHKSADGYGDARIELKSDVKNRSTFMNDDSFSAMADSLSGGTASLISDPSPASFFSRDEYKNPPKTITDSRKSGSPYVEFQAFGGVTARDIAAVHFASAPPKELVQKLRDNGISIFVGGSEF